MGCHCLLQCSIYGTDKLTSHVSKVTLKILQARLQQYLNQELPDVQAGFRKGRGTKDEIANICWILTVSVIQRAHPCMKYSLEISTFLEEIASLSPSII